MLPQSGESQAKFRLDPGRVSRKESGFRKAQPMISIEKGSVLCISITSILKVSDQLPGLNQLLVKKLINE